MEVNVTITAAQVKTLRDKTGAGMMQCKKALEACNGDLDKAIEYLRKHSIDVMDKKQGRVTAQGVIGSYVHMGGKIGVLVEVNCESDFVAKNDAFLELARDLAMQIAAAAPRYLDRESVPADVVEKEREIFRTQAVESGKPPQAIDKIVEGKLKKFFEENCLLEQAFVKDTSKSIRQLLAEKIATIGENISIRRFVRYQVGEDLS
ncbi:MAG: translation elongation factor Ts [Deltaproteobacteria bacterium]|nr:MAG: translation elongation factor Ts [Deltaproteobacteria bacterium]